MSCVKTRGNFVSLPYLHNNGVLIWNCKEQAPLLFLFWEASVDLVAITF